MSGQLDLFAAPATRGASRRDGPGTSRAAGRSMSGQILRDQQMRVVDALGRLGDATAWEVTGWLNCGAIQPVQQNVISKRLGELRDLGMVRETGETRPGSSHRHQMVFALTERGRAVA